MIKHAVDKLAISKDRNHDFIRLSNEHNHYCIKYEDNRNESSILQLILDRHDGNACQQCRSVPCLSGGRNLAWL